MSDGVPPGYSGIPGFSGTYVDVLNIIKATDYLDVTAAALVTYDVFITFEQEVRLVWKGSWGVPTFVYFLNHYGVVLQSALNLVAVLDANLSLNACLSWNLFSNWSLPALYVLIEAMLVLRVVALYGNSLRVSIPLWTLYVVAEGAMFTVMGFALIGTVAMASPDALVTGCQIGGSGDVYWAIWLPSLVLESVLVILTLARAIYHKDRMIRTPILTVLVRDGFIYFIVVFALMLINVVICLATSVVYYSLAPQSVDHGSRHPLILRLY